MPEVRVQDEQGNIHVFPDGSTPEMISQALGLKPSAPPKERLGFSDSFASTYGAPRTPEQAASMLTGPSGDIEGAKDSPYNPPGGLNLPSGLNPGNAVKNVLTNMGQSIADRVKSGSRQASEAVQNVKEGGPILSNIGKGLSGYADIISATNPVVAAGGQGGQQVSEGNLPGAAGSFAGGLSQGYMVGKGAGMKIADTPSPKAVYEAMKAKPQMLTMEQMKTMSPREVSGLEDIYRASAPTGKNPGFRDNLNAALPDLKKVASAIDLSESKGGIISPDMRVRATVKAINGQLDNMYQTERVAQIQRNAGTPVQMRLNTDARRGLEYLANNAGESGTQQLAAAALKRGSLPIENADVLAQTANKYLKSYEKMTSEQKLQVEATNPKIGGLKELDRALGNSLNNTLTSKGEAGLRGYERRYAGLSAVRDALQDRMNAAELDQPGAVKGAIRLASTVMKGKSGLLSASQASVADITAGKALESGFKKLSSGPKR